jgi:Lrp/AsnC family transcriptional regulator for asnA, asnC and gidA
MADELDLKLIRELQKDGRARHIDLAKKLNVVEGTIRKRIRDLVENNIMKTIAAPNISKLGYNFIGFMALQVQVSKLRKIADILGKKPNVCYLAFVTGRYDMIAILITRSPQEFAHLIEKEISAIPGVVRLETFVNLETLKGEWPVVDTTQLLDSIDIS